MNEQNKAKEDAQRLVERFVLMGKVPHQIFLPMNYAKQSALICLEERYKSNREMLFNLRACKVIENESVYLIRVDDLIQEEKQVKKEIEKL